MDGNNYQHAVILETTVITGAVIFLHFKTDDDSNSALVIAGDSLAVNDFRRLRIRLTLLGCGRAR